MAATIAPEPVAAPVADAQPSTGGKDGASAAADAAKKERKREKKERKERQRNERKERERLEREQAEKDAATVAAASAAQAVSAVASATRLPIDPSLDAEVEAADAASLAADADADAAAATTTTTAADANADANADAPPPLVICHRRTCQAQARRPRKDPNAPPSAKKAKREAGQDGERRGRRPKMSEEAAIEELKGLSRRELLVERVYSSDMLAKLERTIGLQYTKGRFSTDEQDKIKNGIAEFMKAKKLTEEDFQELLYNYREKGWEKMYTELWKDLAGRLDGRPNIAVRLHVRTNKSQFRRQGRYTLAEDHEIRERMGKMREDAASVAKRLGRLNQDVLSRFVKLQVKEEMAEGPTWTAQEDKAVIAALEEYKQEHPGEVISWKAIANKMGNKRSYKVYSNLFSNIRSRVDRSGLNPKRDYGTSLEEAEAAASTQAVRGILRHPTRAELDHSVWIPGEDDLILLQRLNFQDTFTEKSVKWEDLSFETWQWPEDMLKQQFALIKSRYLPDGFTGGWQETLDKIIRTIRTRRTKKEIDDEGEDQRDSTTDLDSKAELAAAAAAAAAADTAAADESTAATAGEPVDPAPSSPKQPAPAAIDPALATAEAATTTV
ncbi:uncharacterized protein UMAG_15080 [Mycosarcoma maydis]|uniref:Myb-like domain-containing protein n=1 Tax=Mycosarcoma maydis TaxID=5270 RepID=A0A0D1E7G1_MYCMD|nr:uncharacterized protein UMAG_15080 [Ustilago maydis 521]KIS71451.1 hypothetical protein UMAG_15080 [Ustilago maydis 521]|eukprot:XP_011387517.1 hypothetical protein UMAG_15080 [Ustilago maydis 521]